MVLANGLREELEIGTIPARVVEQAEFIESLIAQAFAIADEIIAYHS